MVSPIRPTKLLSLDEDVVFSRCWVMVSVSSIEVSEVRSDAVPEGRASCSQGMHIPRSRRNSGEECFNALAESIEISYAREAQLLTDFRLAQAAAQVALSRAQQRAEVAEAALKSTQAALQASELKLESLQNAVVRWPRISSPDLTSLVRAFLAAPHRSERASLLDCQSGGIPSVEEAATALAVRRSRNGGSTCGLFTRGSLLLMVLAGVQHIGRLLPWLLLLAGTEVRAGRHEFVKPTRSPRRQALPPRALRPSVVLRYML